MKVINLLDFLNSAKDLYTLEFSSCRHELVNFLDLITKDEQLTQKIDLGIIYVKQKTLDQFVIVDGLSRILSLSLLLHAVCECYKKTTTKNEKAIQTIRTKYLYDGSRTKLKLTPNDQIIYDKILSGDRLSGKEKNSYMFRLLHSFWSQIKDEKLQASSIFKMLKKIFIIKVDAKDVPARDLYYILNKDKREINHLHLIENYLKNFGIITEWNSLKKIYLEKNIDLNLFFKDFFVTKLKNQEYDQNSLYPIFVNYFETMLQYMSEEDVITKIKKTAKLYADILNVNITNEAIKQALIKIKLHNGEDTYAYILNVYEDYIDKNLSEATVLEIFTTINEYLKNRVKTPNDIAFNDLINYLNAFITCK